MNNCGPILAFVEASPKKGLTHQKRKVMKKIWMAAIAATMLVAFTGLSQVQVSWVPGYTAGNGEFNIFPVISTGYAPSVIVNGGYETFCVSRDVSITVPGLYYETVDLGGVYPTDYVGGTKTLTAGSAYLYSRFATGNLGIYDYTLPGRFSSAYYLQLAFWTLEGTYGYGSLENDLLYNPYLVLAAGNFGGGTNGLIAAMLPNSPGGFNVAALDLNWINADLSVGIPAQAMLCLISPTPPPTNSIGNGDTATIGFWQNKNGQALIKSMPNSPALGNWLAGKFPCLYGNLAGKSDTQVAAQFVTYFKITGQKTKAQVMGAALACYVTSSTISGTTAALKYGFNMSSAGTGAKTYNVYSLGTVLGLSNNTDYTVMQLLQAADANCPWNSAVFNALNNIFSDINQTGDIL